MILRLCLKDKSSVLVEGDMKDINYQATNKQFITVKNYNSQKLEMYNKDHIWCIRISSENDEKQVGINDKH